MNKLRLGLLWCVAGWLAPGMSGLAAPPEAVSKGRKSGLEQPVRMIPLAGKLIEKSGSESAEVSGLAWYGDHLIILPEMPSRFAADGTGVVFSIPKKKIRDFLDGKSTAAIVPDEIAFDSASVEEWIPGFQGYEAIAFRGDRAFLTFEAQAGEPGEGEAAATSSHIAAAEIKSDLAELRLTPPILTSIPSQSAIPNMVEESVLVIGRTLLTLHEANGKNVNEKPLAYVFSFELRPMRTIEFPNIEYRITDATAVDTDGRFWCMNFFNPGEADQLRPAVDELAAKFGPGPSHARSKTVERLVEFQYTDAGIKMTDTAPIQLQLADDAKPRNWEGLVRLDDRGFLLMTDRSPGTLLAFVPLP